MCAVDSGGIGGRLEERNWLLFVYLLMFLLLVVVGVLFCVGNQLVFLKEVSLVLVVVVVLDRCGLCFLSGMMMLNGMMCICC